VVSKSLANPASHATKIRSVAIAIPTIARAFFVAGFEFMPESYAKRVPEWPLSFFSREREPGGGASRTVSV